MIALTKYVFLAGLVFVVNAKDEACISYYTHDPRFDHVNGSLLFRLQLKILDALKYLGLYKVARRMGKDPILTILAFHRCSEVEWGKTNLRDGCVFYEFHTHEVYGLKEESV